MDILKVYFDFVSLFLVSFGNNSVISEVRTSRVFFGFRLSDISAIFCFVSLNELETFSVLQGTTTRHIPIL